VTTRALRLASAAAERTSSGATARREESERPGAAVPPLGDARARRQERGTQEGDSRLPVELNPRRQWQEQQQEQQASRRFPVRYTRCICTACLTGRGVLYNGGRLSQREQERQMQQMQLQYEQQIQPPQQQPAQMQQQMQPQAQPEPQPQQPESQLQSGVSSEVDQPSAARNSHGRAALVHRAEAAQQREAAAEAARLAAEVAARRKRNAAVAERQRRRLRRGGEAQQTISSDQPASLSQQQLPPQQQQQHPQEWQELERPQEWQEQKHEHQQQEQQQEQKEQQQQEEHEGQRHPPQHQARAGGGAAQPPQPAHASSVLPNSAAVLAAQAALRETAVGERFPWIPHHYCCLPLFYSGNPGVNTVSYRGAHRKRSG
jgi:hypothetical protein